MNINEYIDKLNNDVTFSSFYNSHNYLYDGNKNKLKSNFKKIIEYENIFNKLLNITLNIFKWDFGENEYNFSERMIEIGFITNNGVCCFVDDGVFILPARPVNTLNRYGEPQQVMVNGFNYHRQIEILNTYDSTKEYLLEKNIGVYQRELYTNYALINYVLSYAEKISDKMRALDVLTQKLKNPFITKCSKEEEKTIRKALSMLFDNDDTILITDNISNLDNSTQLLNTNIHPDLIKAMKESILFDYNNFLEVVGINTDPNPDKLERKLVDEVNANNDLISLQLNTRYKARKNFCKNIKKYFDIDIKVEINYKDIKKYDGQNNSNTIFNNPNEPEDS